MNEVDLEALADERWLVVPDIEDDGTIQSSRVVREVSVDSLGPLTTAVEIVVSLEGRTKVKKLDEQGDRLAAAFERHELVDVCRLIEVEHWRWLGYVRPDRAEAVSERASTIFHSFNAELSMVEDPSRSQLSAVSPTDEERRTANDVHVLTQLATNGDQMSIARRIDHVVGFASQESAVAAAEALGAAGFEVSEPFEAGEEAQVVDGAGPAGHVVPTNLEVSESDVPTLAALRDARARIDQVCVQADVAAPVRYEGWGCPVVPATVEMAEGPTGAERSRRRWFRR